MATPGRNAEVTLAEPALAPHEREFAVLYVDTEPLRAHGWPMPRATTAAVFALAREVGLPVCLPEPVEAELTAQFMRAFAEADEKISSAWREVEGVFRRVNAAPEGAPHRATAGAARAAYERAVVATRQAHQLVHVARSERPLGEYYNLALDQTPPFDANGRGFKDAVILMSVIDDLRGRNVRGLLVTRDSDFQGTETLAERLGAQLIIRNVDEAASILRRRLSAVDQATYAAAERQALALGQRELARFSRFITENLEVPSNVLAEPAEQLMRFLGIHITAVKTVNGDPPFSATRPGDRIKLTYTFGVQLIADVMPIPATLVPATTVKVGSTVTPSTEARDELLQLLVARELHAKQGQKVVVRNVEVDAEAARMADGFENLTLQVARLEERNFVADMSRLIKLFDRPPPSRA